MGIPLVRLLGLLFSAAIMLTESAAQSSTFAALPPTVSKYSDNANIPSVIRTAVVTATASATIAVTTATTHTTSNNDPQSQSTIVSAGKSAPTEQQQQSSQTETSFPSTATTSSDVDSDAGAEGDSSASFNLSNGVIGAICAIVGLVVIFAATTSVLFVVAKRKQWTMRESLAYTSKRVVAAMTPTSARFPRYAGGNRRPATTPTTFSMQQRGRRRNGSAGVGRGVESEVGNRGGDGKGFGHRSRRTASSNILGRREGNVRLISPRSSADGDNKAERTRIGEEEEADLEKGNEETGVGRSENQRGGNGSVSKRWWK